MNTQEQIFHSCSQDMIQCVCINKEPGVSIFFVNSKSLDILPLAILQTIGSVDGLKYGDIKLPKASGVMFLEGDLEVSKLQQELISCDYPKDLSAIKIWSMPTYFRTVLNPEVDEMLPPVDARIADKLITWAEKEQNPHVIFHHLKSLTVGGKLCKPEDFRQLHDRLEVLGVSQIWFVNKAAEIEKITTRPDLVFEVSKVDDGCQKIRLSQISAIARLQDAILPVELSLDSTADGRWCVTTTMSRDDQDRAIKNLAILNKSNKAIANVLGMSASTVWRRLRDMAKNNEIVIGQKVRAIK